MRNSRVVWKDFILEKLCRKTSTKVAVKRENQILSVKKKVQINQPAHKRGGGQEWKERVSLRCRQLASGGEAVSLSTFQRKEGGPGLGSSDWRLS